MQRMLAAMLLPIAFFMFVRRVISQVVLEKEKGMLEYLKMNSMSETANNLAFVLHESVVNGLLISLTIDSLCFFRLPQEDFHLKILLMFNLAVILFLAGITSFSLLISKCFDSASFAV